MWPFFFEEGVKLIYRILMILYVTNVGYWQWIFVCQGTDPTKQVGREKFLKSEYQFLKFYLRIWSLRLTGCGLSYAKQSSLWQTNVQTFIPKRSHRTLWLEGLESNTSYRVSLTCKDLHGMWLSSHHVEFTTGEWFVATSNCTSISMRSRNHFRVDETSHFIMGEN